MSWNEPKFDREGNLVCYYCGTSMKNDFGGIGGEWYCETGWCKSPARR